MKRLIPPELDAIEPLAGADGDLAETERQFETAPSRRILLHFLAVQYYKRGYTRRSMHVCRIITRLEPARATAWQLLARCQLRLRLDDEAGETLELILKMPGASAEIVDWAKKRLDELAPQMPSEEEEESKSHGRKRSPLGEVLAQRDIVTYMGNRSDDTVEAVRRQVEEDPDNAELLDWYAFVLYSADRVEEAIEIYERIVRDFEPTDNTYYYLGSAYLKMADVKTAFVYFDTLRKDFPGSPLLKKLDEKKERLRRLSKELKPRR